MFLPKTRPNDFKEVVLANTSGGLVGGDELVISVEVDCDASAVITSQAAEKAYRSAGPDTCIDVSLNVKSGARLCWIPQATILFDGVRLRRKISLYVDSQGSALAGEILVFGRVARGESLTHGLVHDEWRLHRNGKLAWADSLHLTGDIQSQLNASYGFNGSKAMATLVYASEDAPRMLDWARSMLGTSECWSGATLIGNVLVARWLGKDVAALQREYLSFISAFRASTEASPDESEAILPRLWVA